MAGLITSAVRMVIDHDVKRGCSYPQAMTCWQMYRDDLRPIVESIVATGVDHIHIPRMASSRYIKECELDDIT